MDYVVKQPEGSLIKGLYPLVGWRFEGNSKYLVEAYANSTASLIHWAQKVKIINDDIDSLHLLSTIAESTTPDDSLHFIPGYHFKHNY